MEKIKQKPHQKHLQNKWVKQRESRALRNREVFREKTRRKTNWSSNLPKPKHNNKFCFQSTRKIITFMTGKKSSSSIDLLITFFKMIDLFFIFYIIPTIEWQMETKIVLLYLNKIVFFNVRLILRKNSF